MGETATNIGPSVRILTCTPDPIFTISQAAGTCYGKHDLSEKRVYNCIKAGHESVLEHASATWLIGDISRSCSHQLVRHRLASYSQQSQRYCRIDVNRDDWYVIPPDILDYEDPDGVKDLLQFYKRSMERAAWNYQTMLDEGMKPEDARYLLPEACKTEIVVTMNVREFFHFLDTRLSHRAQWEIRYLAEAMKGTLAAQDEEWKLLMDMYDRARVEL
jgi:thymidylate synthase (FAD)